MLYLCGVAGIIGCAASQATTGKVVGLIYVIGNEPFTSLALQGPEGTIYRIKAAKEIERQLRSLQGKKVELEYSRRSSSMEGTVITVEGFKEIQQ